MKRVYILLAAIVVASAQAQPALSGEAVESQTLKRLTETSALFKEQKPNQTVRGDITYSGILVEAAKVDNPLQLLNPAAPAEYGEAEDNLLRDPITRKASGLKFLSIQF